MRIDFKRFVDETTPLITNSAALKNYLDQITILSQIFLMKNQEGFALALSLQTILSDVVHELQADDLRGYLASKPVSEWKILLHKKRQFHAFFIKKCV